MDNRDRIIQRRLTEIGIYYWLCGNDDQYTVQPTLKNENIVEKIEDKLEDDINPLTIERICDYIFTKYDQMDLWLKKKPSRKYEKDLYVKS